MESEHKFLAFYLVLFILSGITIYVSFVSADFTTKNLYMAVAAILSSSVAFWALINFITVYILDHTKIFFKVEADERKKGLLTFKRIVAYFNIFIVITIFFSTLALFLNFEKYGDVFLYGWIAATISFFVISLSAVASLILTTYGFKVNK
ncbi:MAG: hypothetical protein PHZ19_01510 [Candidatus Thermoplasmatota archaeon]|nr:hypothetical protein [Candidatus Thermoplasmatota archaeon]